MTKVKTIFVNNRTYKPLSRPSQLSIRAKIATQRYVKNYEQGTVICAWSGNIVCRFIQKQTK